MRERDREYVRGREGEIKGGNEEGGREGGIKEEGEKKEAEITQILSHHKQNQRHQDSVMANNKESANKK